MLPVDLPARRRRDISQGRPGPLRGSRTSCDLHENFIVLSDMLSFQGVTLTSTPTAVVSRSAAPSSTAPAAASSAAASPSYVFMALSVSAWSNWKFSQFYPEERCHPPRRKCLCWCRRSWLGRTRSLRTGLSRFLNWASSVGTPSYFMINVIIGPCQK